MLYVGLTLSYPGLGPAPAEGEWLLLFLLLVTWAGDTGAYYVGNLCTDSAALAPRISPKKTVEGLAGGLVGQHWSPTRSRWTFVPEFSSIDTLVLALFLTARRLVGGPVESAIKRSVGVKDSGDLLPGHGGMLDRLDSLLFTAPAFYYYVSSWDESPLTIEGDRL